MKVESKWKLFEIIGKPYAMDILESLSKSPKRYSELSNICSIDKTKTKRLKELKKAKLIETISKELDERTFVYYKLTDKGKKIFNTLLQLHDT